MIAQPSLSPSLGTLQPRPSHCCSALNIAVLVDNAPVHHAGAAQVGRLRELMSTAIISAGEDISGCEGRDAATEVSSFRLVREETDFGRNLLSVVLVYLLYFLTYERLSRHSPPVFLLFHTSQPRRAMPSSALKIAVHFQTQLHTCRMKSFSPQHSSSALNIAVKDA
jgi:hypothetical protein